MRLSKSRTAAAALSLGLSTFLIGCEATGPNGQPLSLTNAYQSYSRGDYAGAYAQAKPTADAYSPASDEAAYLTGLAAYQLQNRSEAERYLHQAARGEDRTLTGQAMAMIGRIYAGQGRHERAVEAYAVAAQRLQGDDRANALFYTALSQQSLGQWREAHTNLIMAKQATSDAEIQKKVDAHLAVRAWTIQLGAYADARNAQTVARNIAAKTTALMIGSPRLVPATDSSGRKLILLQVGQFPSEANAEAAKSRLSGTAEVVPMLAAR